LIDYLLKETNASPISLEEAFSKYVNQK
jgi:hypothetical protein